MFVGEEDVSKILGHLRVTAETRAKLLSGDVIMCIVFLRSAVGPYKHICVKYYFHILQCALICYN